VRATRVALSLVIAGAALSSCAFPSTASTSVTRPSTAIPASTAPSVRTTTIAKSAMAPSATGSGLLVQHLRWVYDARQVISVTTSYYGSSYATVRVFRKRSDGWHQTWGPWPARVGYNGFAPRGDKREGDGRTPTGSFHIPFMFGVNANPGVRFNFRRALSTSYWDDDSSSTNYNRWVDSRYGYAGRSPEHMRLLPNYRYGAVIGYNLDRTPGKGSAIFLHVQDGNATLGCVSVSQSRLLTMLRWLRPSLKPRIIMGTRAAVTT
jgi:L,D-peptidoglycan transpeptidase YkuD (ErfK/YbiS/YcfS/YnhG family)